MEIKWTSDYLLEEAKAIAKAADQTLSIKHFQKVADRDLAGSGQIGRASCRERV